MAAYPTRVSKVLLVWSIALYASLVAFNNITDYDSNYQFVSHVLKMDTTFPGNRLMWRAIDAQSLHAVAYALIILAESLVAALCWWGGLRLLRSVKEARRFDECKSVAVAGLTLGMLLWFAGFITIGGEWFAMWQSKVWNGQESAFRLVVILGITLIYLVQPESEPDR
jgi:predicted small integral membrane protein